MLKDRFGSDFVVANAFRQKLKNWMKISNDDFIGLRHFSDFLCHVQTAKKANASLSCLDDEQENRSLLYKIPDFCHKRWARKVSEASIEKKPYPKFDDFVKLIRIESDIVNNPVTCIKSSGSNSSQDKQSNRKQVHATQSSSEKSSSVSCYHCKQPHVISKCPALAALTLEERQSAIRSNGLCLDVWVAVTVQETVDVEQNVTPAVDATRHSYIMRIISRRIVRERKRMSSRK